MADKAGTNDRASGERPADDGPILEGDRHYLQDPNGILQNARDSDERDQDDVLEIDQRELDELGLALDDPHQPEFE